MLFDNLFFKEKINYFSGSFGCILVDLMAQSHDKVCVFSNIVSRMKKSDLQMNAK